MFALETTVSTEQWYAISWTDTAGHTYSIERPANEAAWYAEKLFNESGTTVNHFDKVAS